NLLWLRKTLEGYETRPLLDELFQKLEQHPKIDIHTKTQVVGSYGQVGNFYTTIENSEGVVKTLEHGVTILATGGEEAVPGEYHYGKHTAIVTQKELEQQLDEKALDPEKLQSVVMIQCVGSREEPRNYCSRICCASALKNALYLKEHNPDIMITILYRDMMSYGFAEAYYTQARRADIIFIQYSLDEKPRVSVPENSAGSATTVQVSTLDPILGRELQIEADLVILASGLVPNLPVALANGFEATLDQDGFFEEAESKWRPVDSLKEGVFACGIAHSPRSIPESIATAEAAAQRALRILNQEHLSAGKIVAVVRHSLCSLCERCIEACPYQARRLDSELEQVVVNPAMCQGCGSCAMVCPNSASILEGYKEQQMFGIIDASLY
ncbi:CoB--CoM heterodisulfide reductase iron-sulfur subunit A family protein, partial [Thermodesulfobacteriota bacterium]